MMTSDLISPALMDKNCVLWPQGKPGGRGCAALLLGTTRAWGPCPHCTHFLHAAPGHHDSPDEESVPFPFLLPTLKCRMATQEVPASPLPVTPWLGARILNAELDVTSAVPKAPQNQTVPN